MKLCRFLDADKRPRVGLVRDARSLLDLTPAGFTHLEEVLEDENRVARLKRLLGAKLPVVPLAKVKLLPPLERQEVWAAGVTYLRSKAARMEESDFSATAYDRVYAAKRPEIFFKAVPERVVGPGEAVGIRRDARWSVPEPELALVFSSRGEWAGCTIGNDMSSRDIEGENLLYLPQAKVYDRSCALGPFLVVGATEREARRWQIRVQIIRRARVVFRGSTPVDRLKRTFAELGAYLFRSQSFAHGAILLTGTGIVPPDHFTLRQGDTVAIRISGIGELVNPVTLV